MVLRHPAVLLTSRLPHNFVPDAETLLPGCLADITLLQMRKPPNFEYKSGQWVRVACLAHSGREFHPFTLTSSPHEDKLSVHIRAVGPWTRNIRKLFDPRKLSGEPMPKVIIDSTYLEVHAVLINFAVSVKSALH